MKKQINYSLYLVTDEQCLQGRELLACIEQALQNGVTLVQYRGKNKTGRQMCAEALEIKNLCDMYNVPLIINDRIDIAMIVKADGVHLGQDDISCAEARKLLGNEYIIGVSAHNVAEAKQALAEGADYLGCGAVFGSSTKNDVSTLGLNNLKQICSAINLPVVGIGGITADKYYDVLKCGAAGAAVISGILGAEKINIKTAEFVKIYNYFHDKKTAD